MKIHWDNMTKQVEEMDNKARGDEEERITAGL